MSEYVKFSISLTQETYDKLMDHCPELVPRSRYIESVLKKGLKKKGC